MLIITIAIKSIIIITDVVVNITAIIPVQWTREAEKLIKKKETRVSEEKNKRETQHGEKSGQSNY
jgi:hypothetical protein